MSISSAHPRRRWRLVLVPTIAAAVLGLAVVGALVFIWPGLFGAGDRSKSPNTASLFRDVAAEAGIDFTYRNGEEAGHYSILETLGGGAALFDFDGDGLLDIFFTGGGDFEMTEEELLAASRRDKKKVVMPAIRGRPCKLYKNLGNWTFRDVTREVGLDGISFYTHGCAVADYDRDGWPDLLVTGYGRLALFHNEPIDAADANAGRRFREVTVEAGLLPPNHEQLTRQAYAEGKVPAHHFWSTSGAWADLDGDGYPDLYVCQYVNWSFANNPPCKGYTHGVERDVCAPKA